jgi:hypothetical protein
MPFQDYFDALKQRINNSFNAVLNFFQSILDFITFCLLYALKRLCLCSFIFVFFFILTQFFIFIGFAISSIAYSCDILTAIYSIFIILPLFTISMIATSSKSIAVQIFIHMMSHLFSMLICFLLNGFCGFYFSVSFGFIIYLSFIILKLTFLIK